MPSPDESQLQGSPPTISEEEINTYLVPLLSMSINDETQYWKITFGNALTLDTAERTNDK